MPARMDEIMDMADYYAIPVIEDAAEAMGSTYKSRPCGTFGKYGIFSFNGNKMITTSGGGALICPNEEMSRKALFYATQAREPFPYYQHECVGYNYRMSNICAGIGCGQMSILHEHIAHHRYLAACYQTLLRDVPGISVHTNPDADISSNYWLSTILIDPIITGTNYEQIRKHLAEKVSKAARYGNLCTCSRFSEKRLVMSMELVRSFSLKAYVYLVVRMYRRKMYY